MALVSFPDARNDSGRFYGSARFYRTDYALGLLVERITQAQELLHPVDLGPGTLSREERADALERFHVIGTTVTALSLFMSVVALEDYVRDLGGRLTGNALIARHFPELVVMQATPLPQQAAAPFKRLD